MITDCESEKEAKVANLAHRLRMQNDINTDYIISGRYKFKIQDSEELAKHVFEDLEKDFHKRIKTGDFLVAGDNFGCGSSREQAPVALKACGVQAVIARSFARIFYRNAFNVGLCLLECETNYMDDMDELEYDPEMNIIRNLSKGVDVRVKPIPRIMKKFLEKGGVIEYFKEYGNFDDVV